MQLWLDLETYSEQDLKAVGTYQYADAAEVLLFAYALDDGPAKVWDCTADEMPDELYLAMQGYPEVWAANAQFDKAVLKGSAGVALPRIALERWRCSMAMALSHALPASLAALCEVLKVPDDMGKLAEGKKLVQLFTRPQPANRKVRRATRHTHPAEWERFKLYAAHDILAMRECVRRMPTWNWDESAIAEWHCDQRINERGFYVDRELTKAGARAAVAEKERIGVRFRQLTEGAVERPSQREQFKGFIQQRFGVTLENTTRDTFEQMMKSGEATGDLRELMELSIASNKTSTAKYAALDPAIQDDSRFRGGLQFAGASRTRRWAGRLFQPQNLPSRGLPDADEVERYIDHLKRGSHDLFFDKLMLFGAAALRGVVIAPPTKKLAVADLANIEGRMLSWVADEQWKLDAFREYDAGTGPDLYNVTASSILGGDPWKVSKKDRNVFGKVPDLASGYMGGVAGYQTFAHAYGVRMADYWDTIQRQIAPGLVSKARENLASWGRASQERLEISDLEWIASETCKLAWRARHPATVRFWYALQDAAKNAINEWGSIQAAGRYIKVKCVTHAGQRWMVVRLPSGRYLTYFDPRLVDGSITYMGDAAEEGKTTRQWVRVYTHGGKMTGNCLTESAKVLTSEGAKPITQVRKGDFVWDGVQWVATDGVIAQGRKAVGTWLGLEITPDHLIHDGNSWKPVTQLDGCSTRDALSWAASSVRSPSFALTPATVALQTALVSAAENAESACDNSGAGRACGARGVAAQTGQSTVGETTTSSLTTNCDSLGQRDTGPWCGGAPTPMTQLTGTTVRAELGSTALGSPTGAPSSTTCEHCLVGTSPVSTSTVKTTTAGTSPATCALSPALSTPTIGGATGASCTAVSNYPSLSSGDSTALDGAPSLQSATTLTKGGAPSGLWQDTTRYEPVYDLLNCGPLNRFTVLTDEGPVIVHNCCQTLARDILMPALQAAETRGYLPVLSVHDEAITEVPDTDEFSAQGLVDILATNPAWATGLPLAAAGFEARRYKKD